MVLSREAEVALMVVSNWSSTTGILSPDGAAFKLLVDKIAAALAEHRYCMETTGTFTNSYDPKQPLQKQYTDFQSNCLCGHSEWCSSCDGTNNRMRKLCMEQAKLAGYQLYYVYHPFGSPCTIQKEDMS